jgi:hypothetical protein
VASTINDSEWLFPVIESIHITGLAVLIGTIMIVDFRILGLALGAALFRESPTI